MADQTAADELRILLISADEETRRQVALALAGRARDYRLFWVSQPDLAAVRAQSLQPQVILLDDALAGIDPVWLTQLLRAAAPSAAIVALLPEGAVAVAGKVVLAGARAFVAKPIDAAQLLSTLGQSLAEASPPAQMAYGKPVSQIIVFCAAERGAGCTTGAVNLAAALQRMGTGSVTVVDADFADPAVHVALALPLERTATDLLTRTGRLDPGLIADTLTPHDSGLTALLAPPERGAKPLSRAQTQTLALGLRGVSVWTVVDIDSAMDSMASAWLDAADQIVVPILPEMSGLRATRQMLDQLFARGYSFAKVSVLLNRGGMPDGMTLEEVQSWLGVRIDHQIPDSQDLAARTASHGVPELIGSRYPALLAAYDTWAGRLNEEGAAAAASEPIRTVAPVAAASLPPPSEPPASPHDQERRRRMPVRRPRGALGIALLGIILALLAAGVVLVLSLGPDADRLTWSVVATPGADGIGSAATSQETATEVSTSAANAIPPTAEPASVATEAVSVPGQQRVGEPPATSAPLVLPEPSATSSLSSTDLASISTPEPSSTIEPTPTASALPDTPTARPTQAPSPTPPAPTSPPTARPTQAPTQVRPVPTSPPTTAPAVIAPRPISPGPSEAGSGSVTFKWEPASQLPPGAAYEVVWWNSDEDPAAARGLAPPTTDTQLGVNLDVLYNSGQFRSSIINWAVLVVNTSPYQRLAAAGPDNSSVLVYAPQAEGGGGAPPPPRP